MITVAKDLRRTYPRLRKLRRFPSLIKLYKLIKNKCAGIRTHHLEPNFQAIEEHASRPRFNQRLQNRYSELVVSSGLRPLHVEVVNITGFNG